MKKEYRVKKQSEFQHVFDHGKSVANRQFVVYFVVKERQAHFRVGLSVSKKLGNAVKRNHIKRCMRQLFQQLEDDIRQEYDFVVIARKPVATMTFEEMKQSLVHVFRVGRLLQPASTYVQKRNDSSQLSNGGGIRTQTKRVRNST